MTESEHCAHERLDYLDFGQRRGWVCRDCGGSGPTVVDVNYDSVSNNVRVLCGCGSGWAWPEPATGADVARYLAEHADCKERAR